MLDQIFSERRKYCDARRHAVALCVCLSVHRAATARRINLGGEGNALYPMFSILKCNRSGFMNDIVVAFYLLSINLTLLDPGGGSQNATLVAVPVVISSLKYR